MDITKQPPYEKAVPRTQSKFLKALASIVSYLFHPVLMPVIMALVLYKLAPVGFAGVAPHLFGQWLIIIAYNTLLFPLLTVGLLKALGFIQDIHMYDARDRIIPLIATMTFYFWVYHVFSNISGSPFILRVLLLGSFWGVILIFLINIFFKVSMHTSGAGSMLGILIVLMLYSPISMVVPFFIALAVAGIIGTARMVLGVHKGAEIWFGYFLGILVMIGAYLYLK